MRRDLKQAVRNFATWIAFAVLPSELAACVMAAQMELSDVFMADAVVMGRVVNYQIVDVGERGPLLNYAQFDVQVQRVFAGDVFERLDDDGLLQITWDNSTFGEPETFDRHKQFLFALRDPTSPLPPVRTGSAFISPAPVSELFTVLQAPCAGAFIFDANSPASAAIQQVLETDRDANIELEILEEFLFDRQALGYLESRIFRLRQCIETLEQGHSCRGLID